MKEQDAKQKWCPYVRVEGANRWEMGPNPRPEWGEETNPVMCRCIASDCALWVWEGEHLNGCHSNGAPCKNGHCGLIK